MSDVRRLCYHNSVRLTNGCKQNILRLMIISSLLGHPRLVCENWLVQAQVHTVSQQGRLQEKCPTPSLATPKHTCLNSCLSYRSGLASRFVHTGFMADKAVLGQAFLRLLQVSLVSIIPPMLHIHLRNISGISNWPVSDSSSTET
jgi:hypothetical protein